MKILFLLFLVIPLVEIYLLIQVGSVIGTWSTIALVVGTALLGAVLVRSQGFSTIVRVRGQLDRGELPALEIFEGLFLLVAGALLLTPGFFTDAVGFACLTPPLRRALIRQFLSSGEVTGQAGTVRQTGDRQGRIIDGEYRDIDG